MSAVEPEAIAAFLAEDPSWDVYPHDLLVATWGFQLFYTVWQANQQADELEQRGFPKTAEAYRLELQERASEAKRKMGV